MSSNVSRFGTVFLLLAMAMPCAPARAAGPYQVVVEGGATVPRWSPAGGMFACYVAGNVLVCDRTGKQLARLQEVEAFSWSPDGSRIAGTVGLPATRVFTAKPDGSDYRILTKPVAEISAVEWASRDAIIVSYTGATGEKSALGHILATGGDISRMGAGYGVSAEPGGHLAFVRDAKEGGFTQIVAAKTDGSSPTVLTTQPREVLEGMTSGPLWSPDGKWLAYVGNDPSKRGAAWLNLVDAQRPGAPARRLLQVSEVPFAWSPDSREIAVTALPATEKGQASLVAVDIAGGATRPLVSPDPGRCRPWWPAWSKDGLLVLHECTTADDMPGQMSLRLYHVGEE